MTDTTTKSDNWIRVTDDPATLPEPGQFVLAYGFLSVWVVQYAPSPQEQSPWVNWQKNYERVCCTMTHWQPLPAPPAGQERTG